MPWYVVGGYADWLGNATAERAFTGTLAAGGTGQRQWSYPDLWHSVNVLVPPDYSTMTIILVRGRRVWCSCVLRAR